MRIMATVHAIKYHFLILQLLSQRINDIYSDKGILREIDHCEQFAFL